MLRNIVFCLILAVVLYAVSVDTVNKDAQCRWQSIQLGVHRGPRSFKGTPVGWEDKGNTSYWGWTDYYFFGLTFVTIRSDGEAVGIEMPSSQNPIRIRERYQYCYNRINILHCTGDNNQLDRTVDLRWLTYTSELDLDKCVGLEHKGVTLYVARSSQPNNTSLIRPFFFRPYYGVAIGHFQGNNAHTTTNFQLFCEVSVAKSSRRS